MPARHPVPDLDAVVVRPLTADTFDLFAALNERNGGLFGGCWCTWFHTPTKESVAERHEMGNRAYKQQLVEAGRAHAALLCRTVSAGTPGPDGAEGGEVEEAIAWATYGPPEEVPALHHRKQYDADREAAGEAEPDYRIVCIVVDKRLRRHGLGARALQGAVELIAKAGGGVVEGYPHDVPPDKKVSSSFLYNTTRTTYEAAGFDYIRPKGQGNCTMRRVVAPA